MSENSFLFVGTNFNKNVFFFFAFKFFHIFKNNAYDNLFSSFKNAHLKIANPSKLNHFVVKSLFYFYCLLMTWFFFIESIENDIFVWFFNNDDDDSSVFLECRSIHKKWTWAISLFRGIFNIKVSFFTFNTKIKWIKKK